MRTGIVQVVVTFALVGFGPQAQLGAQQNSAVRSAVEVTPFVGIGSAASARIGAAIRFEWTHRLGLELEMDYRRAEINALSSSVSLLYDLPRLGRTIPYLAGGVGVEQYGTALVLPGLGVVTQSGLAFTVNAGGGVRVPVSENWGIRTDARWSNGIGSNAPERWRVYNGVTFRRGGR